MTSSIADVDEEDLKLTPLEGRDSILGHDHSRSSFLDGNCNKDVTRRAILIRPIRAYDLIVP